MTAHHGGSPARPTARGGRTDAPPSPADRAGQLASDWAPTVGRVLLVLAHGWLLLMLAVALIAGIAVRVAAAVSVGLLLEIVISLATANGLSDLVLRDVGVLGLAACLTGTTTQRLLLRR